MKRKVHKGEIYDKERTKQKFIDAVGKIIKKEGYTGLGVNKIADVAGVNKKLIYVYFGNVDKLIETYIKNQDYWIGSSINLDDLVREHAEDFAERLAPVLLTNQFEHVFKNKEVQKILTWELSKKSSLMRKVANEREMLGTELFKLTDPLFKNTNIDLRATYSILVAGIYYLIIHSSINGSTFCEIDVSKEADRKRIIKEMQRIITSTYSEAKAEKKK
ncbi:MAG: TetR/AcrR family transcriptional regulator [Sphingobacteriales bacterium]|jgi:AcrR family transcriptional regulator|nr:TetR/AcrR family transcriptional regulator [Sphingobacteriales bacterium]